MFLDSSVPLNEGFVTGGRTPGQREQGRAPAPEPLAFWKPVWLVRRELGGDAGGLQVA